MNKHFPFDSAMKSDNVGLLIGSMDTNVDKVLLALDCTDATIDTAISLGAQLIITHHPVIYDPIFNVETDSVVYRLINNGISVISAHTNLDNSKGGVNDCLADTLNLTDIKTVDTGEELFIRKGNLKKSLTPKDFALFLKEKLGITPRFNIGGKVIKKVLLCGGSGSDLLEVAIKENCDAFVTADVKYHFFLSAIKNGITLFDCGHFHTENVVILPLKKLLEDNFNGIEFFSFTTPTVDEV